MSDNIQYDIALAKVMAHCSAKECCCSDIRKKLESYDLSTEDTEKIMSRLLKEKFIDESRYAKAYVNDKFKYNGWGKIKIASQLKMKQISSEDIREALSNIDEDEYVDKISSLLASKRKSLKYKDKYDLKVKLLRFGMSRGFENDILYKLIGEVE